MKNYIFGMHKELLEPLSLSYLCFGALWCEENEHRYIVGYWFGANKMEVLRQCRSSIPFSWLECKDTSVVYEVYRSIRTRQQTEEWSTRLSFPLSTAFKEPWKDVASGWYVMRSHKTFPLHLSVIHKSNFRLWLEHAAVCEDESELLAFVEKAKTTHHVDLQLIEL